MPDRATGRLCLGMSTDGGVKQHSGRTEHVGRRGGGGQKAGPLLQSWHRPTTRSVTGLREIRRALLHAPSLVGY